MRTSALLVCAGCLLALLSGVAYAEDISPLAANKIPVLGSAYQADKQLFPGGACVAGPTVYGGPASSSFNFQSALSQSDASEQLGLQVGGRAQFGAVSASASAEFARNATSSAYSTSAVWISEYNLPVEQVVNPPLSDVGKSTGGSSGKWAATCGDEFVSEIHRGAKLFFAIRVDFNSKEQKQAFEAKFSLSGPLYSAGATLSQASSTFSRDSKITVSGFQIGGDVSKLTAVFDTSGSGSQNFVDCTLGSFEKCAAVIQAALNYAADTKRGFPSQLAPGVAPGGTPILYRTSSYNSIGLGDYNYPGLVQAVATAREELGTTFNEQLGYKLTIERLQRFGLGPEKSAMLAIQKLNSDQNILDILKTSKSCYDTPNRCPGAVASLKLKSIDPAALELPPLPTADYRLFTTNKKMWTRSESVATMLSTNPVKEGNMPPYNGTSTPDEDIERGDKLNGRMTLDAVGDGEASVVLYIRGVGLRAASLMFEDVKIRDIPLSVSAGAPSSKVFPDGSAMLVVSTSRGNPGWRDIDTQAERVALWTSKMPKADGVFYVLVHDEFGRDVRFDIDYQKWFKGEDYLGGACEQAERVWSENRWWTTSGPGTVATAGGPSRMELSQQTVGACPPPASAPNS